MPLLCKNISAEGVSCATAHFFHGPTGIFEGTISLLHGFSLMQNDV
jgi:hypothetical protein